MVQPRDSRGRFLPKVAVIEPPKSRRTSKTKTKDITQFNIIILDQSSSMSSVKKQTIEGFNSVLIEALESAESTKIKTYYGYTLFGSYVSDRIITPSAPKLLNNDSYRPSGMTALYDAIGSTLLELDKFITSNIILNAKVLVTIITDGEENASRFYSLEYIKTLIELYNSKGWVINFIGAGLDKQVKKVSDSMGIYSANTVSFTANDAGSTTQVFDKLKRSSKSYLSKVSLGTDSNIGFFE